MKVFRPRPLSAPNLSPLIGVLLAVFTVVAVTSVGLGKPVNLYVEPGNVPPPPNAEVQYPRPVMISVQQDGAVYLGAERLAGIDEAVAKAAVEAERKRTDVVSLRADAEVGYAQVAKVVRDLNAKGLKTQFINEELH